MSWVALTDTYGDFIPCILTGATIQEGTQSISTETNTLFTEGINAKNLGNQSITLFDNNILKIVYDGASTPQYIRTYYNNEQIFGSQLPSTRCTYFGILYIIDEDDEIAYVMRCQNSTNLSSRVTGWSVVLDTGALNPETDYERKHNAYLALKSIASYNWQSVLSISGKNGILQSLVQIKEEALNDGEPVSEATVLSFDSLGNINIPSVIDEQMPVDPSDVTSVTATYLIPALENGTYEGIKLLVKKGSIPTSEEDADKVVNLDEPTSILRIDSKSVGNLDEDSHYYFVVKLVDEIGTEATSDPKDIWTSHSEGWTFDYTGQIQIFVAPKTGIYSLETWGAQGGDAIDGTLTARGGYGAYAYGEVLLQQGDTLYINVGGQNGYGGG